MSEIVREWKVIPRVSRVVPFGYEPDPEDDDLLLPIVFELEALEQAKKHLKRYSYRDVAEWLSNITNRPISHMGLQKRIKNDRVNSRREGAYRIQAARLKKILAAHEKAKNKPGRKSTTTIEYSDTIPGTGDDGGTGGDD